MLHHDLIHVKYVICCAKDDHKDHDNDDSGNDDYDDTSQWLETSSWW